MTTTIKKATLRSPQKHKSIKNKNHAVVQNTTIKNSLAATPL